MESPTFQAPPEPDFDTEAAQHTLAKVAAVKQAIETLREIVPYWSRPERRALANAIRLGGRGYTKSAKQ